jgi:hypothetical protein
MSRATRAGGAAGILSRHRFLCVMERGRAGQCREVFDSIATCHSSAPLRDRFSPAPTRFSHYVAAGE